MNKSALPVENIHCIRILMLANHYLSPQVRSLIIS